MATDQQVPSGQVSAGAGGESPQPAASPQGQTAVETPVTAQASNGSNGGAVPPVASQASGRMSQQAEQQPSDAEPGAGVEKFGQQFLLFNAVPSWLLSMVLHVVLLIVLALLSLPPEELASRELLVLGDSNEKLVDDVVELDEPELEPLEKRELAMEPTMPVEDVSEPLILPESTDLDAAAAQIVLDELGARTAPKNHLLTEIGTLMGTGLEGRGTQARGEMVQRYGGSEGSEAAVAAALKWFAAHQDPRDGSWCFDLHVGPCQGRCRNEGSLGMTSRVGATAMALLPFLGAGQTHQEGKYKKEIEAGLYFLARQMKVRNNMGDLRDEGGRLYSHGLASIALCEAYAMTHDKALMGPAQLALNFIVFAQDPVGGGWRYQPRQPGDTSVVGWQLMALKSGHLAYLQVPPNTVRGAARFLDSVQVDGGARYGYTTPSNKISTSAVGLLCRMYLGWKRDNPALQAGVAALGAAGPTDDMYYNYYATQVMRHFEGEPWEKWNKQMRDWLVKQQSKEGHEAGSWYIGKDHGVRKAGRLYCTSMATMILEVYYRHMPIYGRDAAEEDFPL